MEIIVCLCFTIYEMKKPALCFLRAAIRNPLRFALDYSLFVFYFMRNEKGSSVFSHGCNS